MIMFSDPMHYFIIFFLLISHFQQSTSFSCLGCDRTDTTRCDNDPKSEDCKSGKLVSDVVVAVKNVPGLRVKPVEVSRDDVQAIFTAISIQYWSTSITNNNILAQHQEFANKDQRMPAVQLRTV